MLCAPRKPSLCTVSRRIRTRVCCGFPSVACVCIVMVARERGEPTVCVAGFVSRTLARSQTNDLGYSTGYASGDEHLQLLSFAFLARLTRQLHLDAVLTRLLGAPHIFIHSLVHPSTQIRGLC